jgi:hypothetical protein
MSDSPVPPPAVPNHGLPATPPELTPPDAPGPPRRPRSLASKLFGLFLVIFCFEVGLFLIVFPWMDAWGKNALPSLSVFLLDLWENNYFRGALTGLGLVNIWISFQEMARLLRGGD